MSAGRAGSDQPEAPAWWKKQASKQLKSRRLLREGNCGVGFKVALLNSFAVSSTSR